VKQIMYTGLTRHGSIVGCRNGEHTVDASCNTDSEGRDAFVHRAAWIGCHFGSLSGSPQRINGIQQENDMRRFWSLPLIIVLGLSFLCLTATGCSKKTEEVTVEGQRGKEKTYEVEKDRQGNVTNVERTK
jgi:hypothetical protein